jgi:hypothetical protein
MAQAKAPCVGAGHKGCVAHLIRLQELFFFLRSLTREEVEGVHFKHADLPAKMRRYVRKRMRDGMNTMPDGEEVFFISNPGLGLWAAKERFSCN